MNTIGGNINDDYGWELTLFHKIRNSSDGIIFFDQKLNWDRYIAVRTPSMPKQVVEVG